MAQSGYSERSEESWQPARLIPAVGIKGQSEQELRATSTLLAVMIAVPDFGRDIVSRLGAPGGRISTFTEVRFADEEGKSLRPDGAIVVQRGVKRWSCLVEVKTGQAVLRREQIEAYLDIARAQGFDGLLTISNDIASASSELPVSVDQRKAKGLAVHHLSWWRILMAAIVQKEHRGIEDPDQAWILGELIRYLEDDRSGASGFDDMGDSWTTVPDAAAPLDLVADLRTRQLTTSATIQAPRAGRPQTRINWMLRQVKAMRPDLRIEARYPSAREHPSMLLGDALEHPDRLLYGPDPKREARAFDLAIVGDIGRKRGKGPGSFVGDSRSQLLTFYRDVLQQVRAWQPPAPRLPAEPEVAEPKAATALPLPEAAQPGTQEEELTRPGAITNSGEGWSIDG